MADYIDDIIVKKTRKVHRCYWCPELIEIGSEANKFILKEDGFIFNEYWHPECNNAANQYNAVKPDWEDFEPHSQKRGEIYEYDGSKK